MTDDLAPAVRQSVIQAPSRVCTSSEYVPCPVAVHVRATVLSVFRVPSGLNISGWM